MTVTALVAGLAACADTLTLQLEAQPGERTVIATDDGSVLTFTSDQPLQLELEPGSKLWTFKITPRDFVELTGQLVSPELLAEATLSQSTGAGCGRCLSATEAPAFVLPGSECPLSAESLRGGYTVESSGLVASSAAPPSVFVTWPGRCACEDRDPTPADGRACLYAPRERLATLKSISDHGDVVLVRPTRTELVNAGGERLTLPIEAPFGLAIAPLPGSERTFVVLRQSAPATIDIDLLAVTDTGLDSEPQLHFPAAVMDLSTMTVLSDSVLFSISREVGSSDKSVYLRCREGDSPTCREETVSDCPESCRVSTTFELASGAEVVLTQKLEVFARADTQWEFRGLIRPPGLVTPYASHPPVALRDDGSVLTCFRAETRLGSVGIAVLSLRFDERGTPLSTELLHFEPRAFDCSFVEDGSRLLVSTDLSLLDAEAFEPARSTLGLEGSISTPSLIRLQRAGKWALIEVDGRAIHRRWPDGRVELIEEVERYDGLEAVGKDDTGFQIFHGLENIVSLPEDELCDARVVSRALRDGPNGHTAVATYFDEATGQFMVSTSSGTHGFLSLVDTKSDLVTDTRESPVLLDSISKLGNGIAVFVGRDGRVYTLGAEGFQTLTEAGMGWFATSESSGVVWIAGELRLGRLTPTGPESFHLELLDELFTELESLPGRIPLRAGPVLTTARGLCADRAVLAGLKTEIDLSQPNDTARDSRRRGSWIVGPANGRLRLVDFPQLDEGADRGIEFPIGLLGTNRSLVPLSSGGTIRSSAPRAFTSPVRGFASKGLISVIAGRQGELGRFEIEE